MMLRCTKAKMSWNSKKKWNLLVAEEGHNLHHLFNKDNNSGLVVRNVTLAYSHQQRIDNNKLISSKFKMTRVALRQMWQAMRKYQSILSLFNQMLNRNSWSCLKFLNKLLRRLKQKISLFKSRIKIWKRLMIKINQYQLLLCSTLIRRLSLFKL